MIHLAYNSYPAHIVLLSLLPFLLFLLLLKVKFGLRYQLVLVNVVIVVVHAQGVIPLGCIEGQVAQEQAPDKWTQPCDLICDPVEGQAF